MHWILFCLLYLLVYSINQGLEDLVAGSEIVRIRPAAHPGPGPGAFLNRLARIAAKMEIRAELTTCYNYAGQPWKTAFRLRQIINLWYDDRVLGIPGDDDGGALSSWFVFSSMGFFPVTPGRPVYDIGSPLFSQARISLTNGKTFTVVAHNVSARNKYVQSAQLNGKPLNTPWFTHANIMSGGSLILEMARVRARPGAPRQKRFHRTGEDAELIHPRISAWDWGARPSRSPQSASRRLHSEGNAFGERPKAAGETPRSQKMTLSPTGYPAPF